MASRGGSAAQKLAWKISHRCKKQLGETDLFIETRSGFRVDPHLTGIVHDDPILERGQSDQYFFKIFGYDDGRRLWTCAVFVTSDLEVIVKAGPDVPREVVLCTADSAEAR